MVVLRSDSPIQFVKGVGPRRAELFATLGITTVGELLEYFPFRHENRSPELEIGAVSPGTLVTISGEVVRVGGYHGSRWCDVSDASGQCRLRWFNLPQAARKMYVGATVVATGRAELYEDRLELVQPRVQVFPPGKLLVHRPAEAQRVGVYRGNARIGSALIRRTVLNVLAAGRLPVEEVLPAALLHKHRLPSREQAIRSMHCPADQADLERARRRLAYEELLLMELAMALRRRKRLALQTGRKLHWTAEIDRRIRARFPFTLTAAQDQVIGEIVADLTSGRPMTRLLQGDVGSGKTVVALYACLVAIANGKQTAVMAPTEILAQQHFSKIEQYLQGSRVRHVLLRGGLSAKQRRQMLGQIEAGEIDLVVGTQALIQRDVAFNQLALVVVDEQHKFGVLQRHTFRTKGPMPHYLVMTATPIPRTLAMTVFGDLDMSVIRACPPGRGRIVTRVVPVAKWKTVMEYVRGRLEGGEQAYVVCPQIGVLPTEPPRTTDGDAVEGSVASRLTSAMAGCDDDLANHDAQLEGAESTSGRWRCVASVRETYERLMSGPWRGLRVGLLHGALPQREKEAVVADFVAGRLQAVVATTVVEVGVDVPNATIMIVEHADRYGLAQLHQLRGRVGRGSKDSLCILIARQAGAKGLERLAVLARTTDGFKIAEADLAQRGPGELFGTRQHGLPELRVASIINDFTLLEQARADAFALVAADPELRQPEHQVLIPALKQMFGEKLALIDAA